MSLDQYLIRFAPAKFRKFGGIFGGVAQIGINATFTSAINRGNDIELLQNNISSFLTSKGWSVVRVSVIGDALIVVVNGSTSDNLRTVASTFDSEINENYDVANISASFAAGTIVTPPTVTPPRITPPPAQTQPPLTQTLNAITKTTAQPKQDGLTTFLSAAGIGVSAAVILAVAIGMVISKKK